MRGSARWALLLLVFILFLAPMASAQGGAGLAARLRAFAKLPEEKKAELRRRLERLRRMSPEERRALRKRVHRYLASSAGDRERCRRRHDQFRRLDGEHRRRFEKKRQRFHKVISKLLAALPATQQAKLKALPEQERRKALRRMFMEHFAQRHLKRLPKKIQEQLRSQLAGKPFPERMALLRKALGKLGLKHGRGPFRGMPPFLVKHRARIFQALESSRRAGEDLDQRKARLVAVLTELEPGWGERERSRALAFLSRFIERRRHHGRRGHGGPGHGGPEHGRSRHDRGVPEGRGRPSQEPKPDLHGPRGPKSRGENQAPGKPKRAEEAPAQTP